MYATLRTSCRLCVPMVFVILAGMSPSLILAEDGSSSKGSASDPKPKENKVPEDQSLDLDEYLKLGIPAHDRPWASVDIARAAKALATLAAKDPAQLPRFSSKRSGELFERIISPKNLDFYRNKTLPVKDRLQAGPEHLTAVSSIVKLYYAAFAKGTVADTEVIELLGVLFQVVEVQMRLVDEFLPTIPKDDPNYDVRMAGLEKTKQGLATTVMGGLQVLTEKDAYRASERLKLLSHMKKTVPAFALRLPANTRKELLQRVEEMTKDPDLKELRTDLEEFNKLLKEAAKEK